MLFFSLRATTELVPKHYVTLRACHATIQTLTKRRHNAALQKHSEHKMCQKYWSPFLFCILLTYQSLPITTTSSLSNPSPCHQPTFTRRTKRHSIRTLPSSPLVTHLLIVIITIIIKIRHELGVNSPVSVSSNSLFKGLPSRLRPFGQTFRIIFGILLFSLVTCRSQFDLYIFSLSNGSTFNSSKIPSSLLWSKKVCTRLFFWKI